MSFRKKNWVLGASILAASTLFAGCGGSDEMEKDGAAVTPPVVTPAMSDGSVMDVPPTTGLLAFIAANADADGNSVHEIEAGMPWTPKGAGVTFSCPAGDAKCVVTLSIDDDDGSVTATWARAENGGGAVTAMFLNPFAGMNAATVGTVVGIISRGFTAAQNDQDTDVDESTLEFIDSTAGLGLKALNHNKGAKSIDDVMLSGRFDPNQSAPMMTSDDDVGANRAGAVSRGGWDHRVLHADWGDTAGGADAGIETIAAVYSNLEAPMMHDFEDAADLLVHMTPRGWFILIDGAVSIDTSTEGGNVQAMNIRVHTEDATVAHKKLRIHANEEVIGTYFGAAGTFSCTGTGETQCLVSRTTTGDTDFALTDSDADAANGYARGTWSFTPDKDAMVMLPDQDWLAFGFWLTAPDNEMGVHRLGVFSDGMETYDYDNARTTGALTGTATYAGAATGYYVNGANSGMFNAIAALTANFGTNMLSGKIEDFVNSQGGFIDSDNRADPNDPAEGGEGDWAVILGATEINDDASFDNRGLTSGTADGVTWSGTWNAQLYGPGGRIFPATADRPATGYLGEAPTGVAGNFSALTRNLGSSTAGSYKGVVGAFGATLDEHK